MHRGEKYLTTIRCQSANVHHSFKLRLHWDIHNFPARNRATEQNFHKLNWNTSIYYMAVTASAPNTEIQLFDRFISGLIFPISSSTFALVNYISLKPYKPRSHCNILGTEPTYTEVLGKAKFLGTGTKF